MIELTYNGMTMCLKDWSRYTGLHYDTIYKRYKRGWTADQILKGTQRIRKERKLNCGYPECFTCKYEDCINCAGQTKEETKIIKAAHRQLPESENQFQRPHKVYGGEYGKYRRF